MARWTSLSHTDAVLEQAERWQNRCLIGTGSVFTDEEIWTPENVSMLKTLFVDNPILGDQTFYEKLNLQLKDADPDVCKLAAEALWLLLLFVSKDSFGVETKISRISETWALSGQKFPETLALNEASMSGLANPGTAFLTKIWAEYGYILKALHAWKDLGTSPDVALLQGRPWDFCEWMTDIEGGSARSARHMLLYFCYPDYFERISSRNSKKKIYETFKNKLSEGTDPFADSKNPCNLDQSIYQIRQKLEEERDSKHIDFFHGALKDEWASSGHAPSGNADKDSTDNEARRRLENDGGRTVGETKKSLNTIFYGPPGTGKTYLTARRAVEICDADFSGTNEELRARYEQLVKQRRIEFVTFHQTYGYEEFVEGLRPDTSASEDGESGPGFRLHDQPGVLKRIAERARKLPSGTGRSFDPTGRNVFKVSLGRSTNPQDEYLREECLEDGYVLLGYGGEVDWSSEEFTNYDSIAQRWRQEPGEEEAHGNSPNILFPFQLRAAMQEGDIVLASRGNRRLQAVGVVAGVYEFNKRDTDEYHHKRPVKWLWKDETGDGIPVSEVLDRNFSQQSIYGITPKAVQWDALLPYLQAPMPNDRPPPHVLIIDEINRANISKVMGELITLLEEDKRAGAPNEIAVTLPHSGEQFTLPANLHIIGTMNTADRSIALLDTALRRRFQFEEMPPKPGVLLPVEGVDVALVLERLNSRLEWFLGPDQLIGHAWFIGAKSLSELDAAMANKIIPLLREYFHEDVNRVRAVLGGGDGFLQHQKITPPPGIDDYGDDRHRFVDQYALTGSYGHSAYQEVIDGSGSNGSE